MKKQLKEIEDAFDKTIRAYKKCLIHSGTDEEFADAALADAEQALAKLRGMMALCSPDVNNAWKIFNNRGEDE